MKKNMLSCMLGEKNNLLILNVISDVYIQLFVLVQMKWKSF